MSFSQIARVYDRFNDLESYEKWLDFTLNSVEKQPQKALDVACGTGWFPMLLAPFVGELLAVDINEEMLAIARAEDPHSLISYQQADMLNMSELAQDFDLVTCFADSLCFLNNQDEVQQAIKEMLARLVSGGVLLFDVWTPYQLSEGFDEFSYFDSDEEGAILWDSDVDREALQVEHYLTVFQRINGTNQYERVETVLRERTYALSIYQMILAQLPVAQVEVLVDYGMAEYDAKCHSQAQRWFFRVVKQ